MAKVFPGAEVENVMTGEVFTYIGVEVIDNERIVKLDNEGQTHRVDTQTFREFFRALG